MTTIFVYGTLQTGQCRESCWPLRPIEIVTAWTLGTLYFREDYPAMKAGRSRVQGQLWRFSLDQIDQVLRVLDEVEAAPTLYTRLTVEVFHCETNQSLGEAWTYHYTESPENDGFQPLVPSENGFVHWP
ncbi:MAG: gamma-glutamylcyclotransferase family protein [Planctomycetota bacterium]